MGMSFKIPKELAKQSNEDNPGTSDSLGDSLSNTVILTTTNSHGCKVLY